MPCNRFCFSGTYHAHPVDEDEQSPGMGSIPDSRDVWQAGARFQLSQSVSCIIVSRLSVFVCGVCVVLTLLWFGCGGDKGAGGAGGGPGADAADASRRRTACPVAPTMSCRIARAQCTCVYGMYNIVLS